MIKLYPKSIIPVNWRLASAVGCLLLALAFNGAAQGKREFATGLRSRKASTISKVSSQDARAKTQQRVLRTGESGATQPRSAQEYSWNATTNAWVLGYNHAYTYNTNGLLTEDFTTQADNTNFSRFNTTYDTHKNVTEDLQYYWTDDAWILSNGFRDAYTYTNGKVASIVSQFHKNGVWSNSTKQVFTYNTAGHLTDITAYGWDTNAWVIEDRTVLGYTAGSDRPISVTYQEWENNAWKDFERYTDIVWHSFENTNFSDPETWQLASYTYQERENNGWVNLLKETRTYSANDSYVAVGEEWVNNAWVNAYRYADTFDEKGNLILGVEESWVNGAWVIENGFKYLRTYDSNGNMAEVVFQRWEPTSEGSVEGAYVNQDRYVYSNFQVVLSAKEDLEKLALQVYPNPMAGKFSIRLDQNHGATAKVMSLAGQALFTTSLTNPAKGQEINISHLPAGTYILQIQTKTGVRSQKIVKL
ncbi:T9SS type A sorting domain-containing protein [Rufibacter latericius]|nr:T9SS type A sorting domain-containing protein [Rufibacter latericius]